ASVLIPSCTAQPSSSDRAWAQLLAAGQQLQAQGHYAEAEAAFKSSLDKTSQPVAIARLLNNLAEVPQVRGDYPAAVKLYRQARPICEQGRAPTDLAAMLLNQALVYEAWGQLDRAEALGQRSLEIHRSQFGARHSSVADPLDTLGWIHLRLGRYAE